MKYIKVLILVLLGLGFMSPGSYAEEPDARNPLAIPVATNAVECKPVAGSMFTCNVGMSVSNVEASISYIGTNKTIGVEIQGPEAVVYIRSTNGHGDEIVEPCERAAVKAHTEGTPFKMKVTWLKTPPSDYYGATWLKVFFIPSQQDNPVHVKCFF